MAYTMHFASVDIAHNAHIIYQHAMFCFLSPSLIPSFAQFWNISVWLHWQSRCIRSSGEFGKYLFQTCRVDTIVLDPALFPRPLHRLEQERQTGWLRRNVKRHLAFVLVFQDGAVERFLNEVLHQRHSPHGARHLQNVYSICYSCVHFFLWYVIGLFIVCVEMPYFLYTAYLF